LRKGGAPICSSRSTTDNAGSVSRACNDNAAAKKPPQPTYARTDYALGEGQSQLDMSSSYKYLMRNNDARLAGIEPLKRLLLRSLKVVN
jgi:hypothetical protein